MGPNQLFERLLPIWRLSHLRRLAVADFLRTKRFPDVVAHAKAFLDLNLRKLPAGATYALAIRLADEVLESLARAEGSTQASRQSDPVLLAAEDADTAN